MEGELRGSVLEQLPSVMTDWRAWKAEHPESTVLAMSRTSREYLAGFQKRPATFVLGVEIGGATRAYPFDILKEKRVVSDVVGKEPVVVVFDPESTAARMFRRTVEVKP